MFRVAASKAVPYRGKMLFASSMQDFRGFIKIASGIGFLMPPLVNAGFKVLVSKARVVQLPRLGQLSCESTAGFEATLLTKLQEDIGIEQPDFVGFPVYDENVLNVFAVAQKLAAENPNLALAFGGPFISLNPEVAVQHFGALGNVIMINGEAEFALPQALEAYQAGTSINAPGMFVKRDGVLLGGAEFTTRVALTAEEHESLDFVLDVQEDAFRHMMEKGEGAGIDLFGSRGCFRGCAYCAASNALRSRFVTWSPERRLHHIGQAVAWAKRLGNRGVLKIGFQEDNWGFVPKRAIEFLDRYRESPLVDESELHVQMSFADFFRCDGSFRFDLLDAMMKGDTPMVKILNLGGDFWDQESRTRNRGTAEGRLTNDQIRFAISEFVKREIAVKLYWLFGDEKTTIASFAESALFLSELYIDFAPYIKVEPPDLIIPYSGTPIRGRLEADATGRELLDETGALGRPGEAGHLPIYTGILTPIKILNEAYLEIGQVRARFKGDVTADTFLCYIYCLAKHWQTFFNASHRRKLSQALEIIDAGGKKADALAVLEGVPTSFQFLKPRSYTKEELFDLVLAARMIPPYYERRETLNEESARRNVALAKHYRRAQGPQAERPQIVRLDGRDLAVAVTGSFRQETPRSVIPRIKGEKIGRNQACPCGSGKKYKKCCL